MDFVGYNPKSAKQAFKDFGPQKPLHGITDGTWYLIDGIWAICEKVGKSHVVISTWTAANADISSAESLLNMDKFLSLRFFVDRSFKTRQPDYYEKLVKTFGQDAVCFWSSHAKFALFTGGDFDVLYLTSANLNKNPRIENFSLITDGDVIKEYAEMVDKAFERLQGEPPGMARRVQKEVFAGLESKTPGERNPNGSKTVRRDKEGRYIPAAYIQVRRIQAFRMHVEGKTNKAIAEEFGVSAVQVGKYIRAYKEQLVDENREVITERLGIQVAMNDELRAILKNKLEQMELEGEAGSDAYLRIIDRINAISDREAKLLGLFSPEKLQIQGSLDAPATEFIMPTPPELENNDTAKDKD